MKQCPNCKCQVGSGVSVCPYCGAQLPVDEEFRPEKTGYPPTERSYPGGCQRTQHTPYHTEYNPAAPADTGPQVPYYVASPCGNCPERGKNQNTLVSVLVILLICMLAANIFELVALLLVVR